MFRNPAKSSPVSRVVATVAILLIASCVAQEGRYPKFEETKLSVLGRSYHIVVHGFAAGYTNAAVAEMIAEGAQAGITELGPKAGGKAAEVRHLVWSVAPAGAPRPQVRISVALYEDWQIVGSDYRTTTSLGGAPPSAFIREISDMTRAILVEKR